MMELVRYEVGNSVAMMGLKAGDHVVVNVAELPRGNGEDLGVFKMNGEPFISPFTRFGKQILFLQKGEPIRVVNADRVEIIGTVVKNNVEKAPAATGANLVHA